MRDPSDLRGQGDIRGPLERHIRAIQTALKFGPGRPSLPAQDEEGTTQSNITSSTMDAGSPICGVAFTAPPSGMVWVHWAGFMSIVTSPVSTNSRRTEIGWQLREGSTVGSGSMVVAGSSTRVVGVGIANGGSIPVTGVAGASYLVTGLTPGEDYNVRTMHRVNAANAEGSVSDRRISVQAA